MKKYRKKPLVIEAVQWTGEDLPMLEYNWDNDPRDHSKVTIKTLEGRMRVSHGDYIIKGIKGEFYSCKPDVFEASYEEVTDG